MPKPQDDIRARAAVRQQQVDPRTTGTPLGKTSGATVEVTQPGVVSGLAPMAGVDPNNPPTAGLEPAVQPEQPEPIRPRVMPNPGFVPENNVGPGGVGVTTEQARFAVQPDPRQPAPDPLANPPADPSMLTGRPNPYERNADGSLRNPDRHTSGPLAGQPVKPGETSNDPNATGQRPPQHPAETSGQQPRTSQQPPAMKPPENK